MQVPGLRASIQGHAAVQRFAVTLRPPPRTLRVPLTTTRCAGKLTPMASVEVVHWGGSRGPRVQVSTCNTLLAPAVAIQQQRPDVPLTSTITAASLNSPSTSVRSSASSAALWNATPHGSRACGEARVLTKVHAQKLEITWPLICIAPVWTPKLLATATLLTHMHRLYSSSCGHLQGLVLGGRHRLLQPLLLCRAANEWACTAWLPAAVQLRLLGNGLCCL